MKNAGPILLEICVGSLADAIVAEEGGADRLELNSALALGGLTPSLGTLLETRAAVVLPIVAMARPRPGGFAYGSSDFRVLERDIDLLLEHGADGIAFGILLKNGEIDRKRCQQVMRGREAATFVFHRAFDLTPNPIESATILIDLGVRRILTSGQRAMAEHGIDVIAALQRRFASAIEVLPAAGIRADNVAQLLVKTGCTQVHASCSHPTNDPTGCRGTVDFSVSYPALNKQRLKELRSALDRYPSH